jgi:hypothetical protein
MLRRLLIGLVLGLVVGGAVAAGLVAGLGVHTFASAGGAVLAYLAAALTGVLTGLFAGKPIWSSGAKIEAGLKAFSGALIAAGVMFALRQWTGSWTPPDFLPAIGLNGQTPLADLPAVSLPLLAALLGGLFELDNTGGDEDRGNKGEGAKKGDVTKGRQRVATRGAEPGKARPAKTGSGTEADSDDEAELISTRAKR